jgi:phosphoglycolate phosphatase
MIPDPVTLASEATAHLPLLMFDHDGVLVDSLDVFAAALIEGCRRSGIPGVASVEDVVALYDGNVYESLARTGAQKAAIRQAVDHANRALHEALPTLRPFPDMLRVLNRLATTRHVVIVTSNAEAVVRSFLDRNGMAGVEIAGAESGHSKVEKIRRLLARHPRQEPTWLVSDTAGDMREARLASVTPLGVAWGWHEPARLVNAGAETIADTPADLLAIVAPELTPAFPGADEGAG